MTTKGEFVPLFARPRNGAASARVGWITDANGCDIWQGSRSNGRGKVKVGGRLLFVHRLRYEREVGPIPDGLGLDHFVCNNGPGGCCNPHHCRPATWRENALRGETVASAHAAKTHCPRGHPLTGENLLRKPSDRGARRCRACISEYDAARYARRTKKE